MYIWDNAAISYQCFINMSIGIVLLFLFLLKCYLLIPKCLLFHFRTCIITLFTVSFCLSISRIIVWIVLDAFVNVNLLTNVRKLFHYWKNGFCFTYVLCWCSLINIHDVSYTKYHKYFQDFLVIIFSFILSCKTVSQWILYWIVISFNFWDSFSGTYCSFCAAYPDP